MKLTKINDKWHVNAGFIDRSVRAEMVAWCYESWQSGWGECLVQQDQTVFIFDQLQQANWFMLKWN